MENGFAQRILKLLRGRFPHDSRINHSYRDNDLEIGVSWPLHTDPDRPNKESRTVIIKIPREVIGDYLNVPDPKTRRSAERQMVVYVGNKLKTFNPEHNEPLGKTPTPEIWLVPSQLFHP
jgi:hypothetical protein